MQSNYGNQANVYEILRRYSSETPKEAAPREPVLLAKPENYDILFNTQGLALVKGLYGYGKTYGYGLKLYHQARTEKKFDTVYINIRETRLQKGFHEARRDILDLLTLICSTDLNGKRGVYLATSTDAIVKACARTKIVKGDPIEVFREFLEEVASNATKRLFLVIDELEEVAQLWGRKDRANVYNIIRNTLLALRPGVMDKYPYKLTLVYLIQEVLYPTQEMKDLIKREAITIPALGRILATSADGSIISKYNLTSFIMYIDEALNILEKQGIDKSIIDDIRESLFTKGVLSKIENYLVNMPAFIAFDFIHRILDEAVTDRGSSIEVKLYNLINSIPIYKIYGGTRGNVTPEQLTKSLIYLAESLQPGEKLYPNRILRLGYEGIYTIKKVSEGKKVEFRVNIYLIRFSEIKYKDIDKHKKEFIRLYNEALEICKEPNATCNIYILHPHDIDIQPILMALESIVVGNKKLNLAVTPITLSYDGVFTLLVAANEDIPLPAIVRSFVEEKFRNDLLNIINSQIGKI